MFGERLRSALWKVRRHLKPFEDPLLSTLDLGLAAREKFCRHRATLEYGSVYEKPNPLVSICIATYNRATLLRERSLASCLAQTYPNIEIIIVGDACTDETEDVIRQHSDSRIRFFNLDRRGDYPKNPKLRWMVAGTAAVNCALSMARGDFITHLDDDDEHAPERVEVLLETMVQKRADLIYHPFRYETADGQWRVNPASSFRFGSATTSSIFYHQYFRHLAWDPRAFRYHEPGDWNRLRKISFLGAQTLRHPDVLLTHYRERNQQVA